MSGAEKLELIAKPALTRHRVTDEERKLRLMPEKELASYVARVARLTHWRRFHTYRAERSPAGFPDECMVKGPWLLFAELKREAPDTPNRTGKPRDTDPTEEQVHWLDDLAAAGQMVFLWRPRDMDDIAKVLGDPERYANAVPSRWRAPK